MKLIALPQPNNNKANSTQFGNLMKQTEGHCLCEMRNTSVCFRVLEFNTCPTHMTEWPAARAIKEKPWMADSGHQSESIVFLEKLDLNPSTFPHSIKSGNISEIWLKFWHFVIDLRFGFRKRKFFLYILYTAQNTLQLIHLSQLLRMIQLSETDAPLNSLVASAARGCFAFFSKNFQCFGCNFAPHHNKLLISTKNDNDSSAYLRFWKDTRFFKFWKISDKNIC